MRVQLLIYLAFLGQFLVSNSVFAQNANPDKPENKKIEGSHLSLTNQVSFGSQQVITTEALGATTVFATDLDGDGDSDVLSASQSDNKIAWYENDGTGIFGNQQIITSKAEGAIAVFAADLDGDGDTDVLSSSIQDNKIAWYENDGTGGFSDQKVITSVAEGAIDVFAADLDGDGDIDVLSGIYNDNKIVWYENDGTGVFDNQQLITSVAEGAIDVFAADLDEDGDLDVLSASQMDNKIAWYENDGAGGFSDQKVISVSTETPLSVHAIDLDGDGDTDVLSASASDDKIAWYENDGVGGFGNQKIISVSADGATSVYATDLDGDGDADVLSASQIDGKIAWYKNNGSGGFGGQQIITTSANRPTSVFAMDLNSDGSSDVLSASQMDNKIAWYENLMGNDIVDIGIEISEKSLTDPMIAPSLSNIVADYDQRKFWIPILLTYNEDTILKNIKISATLNGNPLDLEFGLLDESIDADGDKVIDQLPLEGIGKPNMLFISQSPLENDFENGVLKVTIDEINGNPVTIEFTETINMYFAKDKNSEPYVIDEDGYGFRNPTKLSLKEYTEYFLNRGINGGIHSVYYNAESKKGRCYGMAGTAGLYFSDMLEKPIDNEPVNDWELEDFDVSNNINLIHISQNLNNFEFDNIDQESEYQALINELKLGLPTMLAIAADLKNDDTSKKKFAGHAILATKVTEFNDLGIAIIETNDSNGKNIFTQSYFNLTSNSFDYSDASSDNFKGTYDKFLNVKLSDINKTYLNFDKGYYETFGWITRPGSKLISYGLNTSTNKSKGLLGQNLNSPSFLVRDSDGNTFGFDGNNFINEINGADFERVPTADGSADSLTYIFLPEDREYTTTLKSTGENQNVRMEYYGSSDDSSSAVSVFENIEFKENTEVKFDESTSTDEVQVDSDGDGDFESKETNTYQPGNQFITTGDFGITTSTFEDSSDWSGVIDNLMGDEYRVGDWNDLVDHYENGNDLLALFDDLGLTDYGASVSLTRNGDPNYSDTRFYYASRHEGNKPGNYLAHDNISNYMISLGSWEGSRPILAVKKTVTSTEDESILPSEINLSQNYPNPFNPTTEISYSIPNTGLVRLEVFNIAGQTVALLVNEVKSAGHHNVTFDASNFASGLYLYRLESGDIVKSKKMLLIK